MSNTLRNSFDVDRQRRFGANNLNAEVNLRSKREKESKKKAPNLTEDPTGPRNKGPRRSTVDGAGLPSTCDITCNQSTKEISRQSKNNCADINIKNLHRRLQSFHRHAHRVRVLSDARE
jgi:hypothetical protein